MNRVPRSLAVASAVGLCLALSACGTKPPPPKIEPSAVTPADVGGPLYVKAPMPMVPRLPAGVEPVVVSQAVVQPDERIHIASQVEGTVLFYGVRLATKPAVLDGNVIVQKYETKEGDVFHYFRRLRPSSSQVAVSRCLSNMTNSSNSIEPQIL